MPERERCPSCRTHTNLVDSYSLLFTMADWPLVLVFAGCVIAAGDLLGLPAPQVCFFALLSIVPIVLKIFKKKNCTACGVEFEVDQEAAPPMSRADSARETPRR